MQRKKTFIVVWLSIVLAGQTSGQIIADNQSINPENASRRALERKLMTDRGVGFVPDLSTVLSASPGYGPLILNMRPIKPGENRPGGENGHTGIDHGKIPFSSTRSIILEEDYYTRHFGFFCKKELVIDKAIHLPLRFRLGSLEYCNSLEGKK